MKNYRKLGTVWDFVCCILDQLNVLLVMHYHKLEVAIGFRLNKLILEVLQKRPEEGHHRC